MTEGEQTLKWSWEKRTHCPACGKSDGAFVVYGSSMEGRVKPYIMIFYIACPDCGMVFQGSTLDEESMKRFYEKEYRTVTNNGMREGLRPMDIILERQRAERVLRYAKEAGMELPNIFWWLDVGCGSGELLEHVWKQYGEGAHAIGIEPNDNTRKMCLDKRLEVRPSLGDAADDMWDVVSSLHVLEHIVEPYDYLLSLKSRLKSTGYLVIDIPHLTGRPSRVLGLPHVGAFLPETLKFLAERAGFEVIWVGVTMDPYLPHLTSDITLIARPKPATIEVVAEQAQEAEYV